MRIFVFVARKTNGFDPLHSQLFGLFAGRAADTLAVNHVLKHRAMGRQRKALKNHADLMGPELSELPRLQ